MTDDPDFYAWLDGELAEPQASQMAARVAADPDLSAFAAQHRALGNRLAVAFAPVVAAPIPSSLAAAIPTAEIVDFAAARERRRVWSVAGLAAAASLALGLALGVALPGGGNGNLTSQGARLAASGDLAGALDRQLASAGEQRGIRIGLSFRDKGGRLCRSFSSDVESGLACRTPGGWAIEGLIAGEGQVGDYRMASGIDPALGALIDDRIAGEPLDAEGEARALRERN